MKSDALQLIKAPVAADLERFNELFRSTLSHDNPLLNAALQHIVAELGKQMRPTLTLLSARLLGEVNQNVLDVALSLELLHTATLLHDDVVDESNQRRGLASLNASFGNKVAVLVGDFVLSKALQHATFTKNITVFATLSELGQTLSDGELLELSNAGQGIMDEASYFEVNRRKTASLFSACAQLGALMGGATDEEAERMHHFGQLVGMSFQLRDDVFDLTASDEVGKPVGKDMREGKVTLPTLYAIHHSQDDEMTAIAARVRAREATDAEIETLMRFTIENGGLDYARWQMDQFRMMAAGLIQEHRNADAAQALRTYMDYVIDRDI